MFENVLQGIIPIWILGEGNGLSCDLSKQGLSVLSTGGFGDEDLDDTEALVVGGDFGETVLDLIDYKAPLRFLEAFDNVLNDVSALGVLEGSRNGNLTQESSTTCPASPF